MSRLPDGLIAFGPNANCTLDLCPLSASVLEYQPSVPASATFIGLFSLWLLLFVVQGVWTRTWGFTAAMVSGCVLEIVGYLGRIMIHDNPFSFNGFLIQIICITVAPVFFCSAIYVLLSQIITHVDPSISRLSPRLVYWIFIPCDVVSLVLQAVGGALSSLGKTRADVDQGVHISLGGLVFQVVTLTAFCILFVDYIITCRRKGRQALLDKRLKVLLVATFLSALLILLRCTYRIVELHEGYFSHWFRDEPMFIALESVVMAVAVPCLIVGHPGFTLIKSKAFDKGDQEEGHSERVSQDQDQVELTSMPHHTARW
ncbi:parasitic phase-specific protein PSP-1 [Elsinoe ampelina]|uniref:Parasitic phase-specific protein PSP-1 n=1 Tax=Elsinoe ampelina TaxID=302913 RepID=A0A6A6G723_9PEZI|nr:parasitic phase-specific protein PSP-1 [Elsinoe ampelina]